MQHSPRHLEGIAREIHERTSIPVPIDAFVLAKRCGLATRGWGKGQGEINLETGLIRYPLKARASRQHGTIAHEIGHWALNRAGIRIRGLEDEEAARAIENDARYLAGALMLPRDQFRADLAATDWDLFELLELHPNVSAEMVVVRMTQVSSATASVWDGGHLHATYGAHDVGADRELVDRALSCEVPVRGEVSAWPMIDGVFRRVLCVRRAA